MKKIFFLLLAAAPLALMAQNGKYTVEGKIGSLNSPAIINLIYFLNDGTKLSESTVPKNGSFKLTGKIDAPVRAFLIVSHHGKREDDGLELFLEDAVIKVSSRDSAKNATIKGSKLTEDLQKMHLRLKPAMDKMNVWNAEWKSFTSGQKKQDTAIEAGLWRKFKTIMSERAELLKQFIRENPGTVVSLEALNFYANNSVPEYDEVSPLFLSLSDKVRNSKKGQEYATYLQELVRPTSLGAQAPEFTQNDTNGTPVSLKSFRGKYVLIDFWASWCIPCRAGNPELVKTYQEFKDKNFTILGVSLDSKKDPWLKAIAKDKLEWTHVSDLGYWKNAVAVQYGIKSVPQTILVGPDGKIVAKNLHAEELRKKLGEILK